MNRWCSPLERQVADVLRRARRLPIGPDRNDLRQLAVGLLWLHRKGVDASFGAYGPTSYIKEQPGGTIPGSANEKSPAEPG